MGIGKKSLLEEYYFDEFLTVLHEHNELHSLDKETSTELVGAEDW